MGGDIRSGKRLEEGGGFNIKADPTREKQAPKEGEGGAGEGGVQQKERKAKDRGAKRGG